MKRYCVSLNGQNFILDHGDGVDKLGFYTTRLVKAENPDSAEKVAVDLVRNDPSLKESIQNSKNEPPMIYLEEIREIGWFEYFKMGPGGGYTFYPESECEEPANHAIKADEK